MVKIRLCVENQKNKRAVAKNSGMLSFYPPPTPTSWGPHILYHHVNGLTMKWYTYEEIERYIQIIERKGGIIKGVYRAEMRTLKNYNEI